MQVPKKESLYFDNEFAFLGCLKITLFFPAQRKMSYQNVRALFFHVTKIHSEL